MGRYLAFILAEFLIIGSGCHNVTGPPSSNNLQLDTTPHALRGFSLSISIRNVVVSFLDDFGTYYLETGKTTHNQTSGEKNGSFSFIGVVAVNSFFVKNSQTITSLNFDTIPQTDFHFFAFFSNLSYTTLVNDTMQVILKGSDAAKNILTIGMDYSHTSSVGGTVGSGHYQDFETHKYDYFQCTDSTELVIKMHL